MRGGVLAAVAAVLLALAVPAAGAAQAPLPLGETKGVRIVRERGALVVVFTQRAERLRRKVAGKLVSVLCTEFVPGAIHSGGVTQRAPRRGRRIETGDLTRGMDYCRLWLAARTVRRGRERIRRSRELLVSVPLTQEGAVFLDEEATANMIAAVLMIGALVAEERNRTGYLTPAELLEALPPGQRGVVALAAPSDTPPARVVGYYSDGAQHAATVGLSTQGRRLFLEVNGDVLHTNIAGHVFRGFD
jgi:hypothetical protein